MVRSQRGADYVTDGLVAAHSFGIHLGKNRLGVVHIIVNDNLALAVVKTVQPANVLLQCASPGNRHGKKKRVEARIVEAGDTFAGSGNALITRATDS